MFTINKTSFSLSVMNPSFTQEPKIQKSSFAYFININSFNSSMAMLSGCSRGFSCIQDFHFYFNFEEFKNPIQEIFENPLQEIFENPILKFFENQEIFENPILEFFENPIQEIFKSPN
ncbi:hypothetical protein L6452_24450 [Arctium lappa]|uniref:Uncharacterized protein n=1 Tax=Arctium lappa TaxID=4217 RepID=A0ACB9A9D3_ARCLA|nr:hypothetical protein L6452_24450 [Arctium lappa]